MTKKSPTGIGRPPGKTGQPHWFKQMKFDAKRDQRLAEIPLINLRAAIGGTADLLSSNGYKTVLDLSKAELIDLRYLCAPKEIETVHKYLKRQQVPLRWELEDLPKGACDLCKSTPLCKICNGEACEACPDCNPEMPEWTL